MGTSQTVAITGASGLVGRALADSLRADGHRVVTIGRGEDAELAWNPAAGTITPGLTPCDAIVHLAGASIGQRWSAAHRREIIDSRVQGTNLIARAAAGLAVPPRVLVSASAVGYYGSRGDEWLTEESDAGTDFLGQLGRQWEESAEPARDAGIRVVHPRIGVVLSPAGGALEKMLPVFRLGAGAPLGNGRQWMSWISLDDLVAMLRFVIDTPSIAGPVNAVAPAPATNRDFTAALAAAVGMRAFLPAVPAFVLKAAYGEMASATILASQRVRPVVLERAGFRFRYATLDSALQHALAP